MTIMFMVMVIASTVFFKEQMEPFVIHSDLSELEVKQVNFRNVLLNNIVVCAIAISGIYLFRIPSFLVYIVNPIALGFVLAANWVSTGEIIYFVRMLIPHSIFEVPAIVIACSMGIRGKKGRENFKDGALMVNVIVILILLIVAAVIECTISAKLT